MAKQDPTAYFDDIVENVSKRHVERIKGAETILNRPIGSQTLTTKEQREEWAQMTPDSIMASFEQLKKSEGSPQKAALTLLRHAQRMTGGDNAGS